MLTESGSPIQAPAEEAAILQMAACCALCNDSTLTYNSGALRSCMFCTGIILPECTACKSRQRQQLKHDFELFCRHGAILEGDANRQNLVSKACAPVALVPV